ncbi:hypothetical protein [Marimonas arenosa]|uniref:Uncharacterized protein n=1 Tax=Marimonas arenosa TaxID=1795305 RepID=A0AAE4B4Y3_9RHOB|nr:hypothetical protein [Marimonas arenosa]MDQ2089824.1 hypothetical protein [Marimonas arenosa]
MSTEPLPALPDTPFWCAYQGRFAGFPTWPMFDRFWPVLAVSGGEWFILDLDSGTLPEAPASAEGFAALLAEAQAMYEPARSRSFAGVVFADDAANPSFVKLFDPWKMGASCGSSGERILPRWVLSRMRPDALPVTDAEPRTAAGFFARIAGRD